MEVARARLAQAAGIATVLAGCPFQEAAHGQSKRAHRAQVGVTAAALGTAVGSGEGGSGSAG
eukprot:969269-Prymnesium_polylepis.1